MLSMHCDGPTICPSPPGFNMMRRAINRGMRLTAATSCPYCGALSDLDIDEDGGSRQSYVQDCSVCCQPWQVEVLRDREADWHATLRIIDE
jgi:hypothetical protein